MGGYAYDTSSISAKEQRMRRIAGAVQAGMTWAEASVYFNCSKRMVAQAIAYLTAVPARARMP